MFGQLQKLKSDTGAVRLRVKVNTVQYFVFIIQLFLLPSGV